jgi:GNAT superfamily N-acetyltransferase
MTIELRPYRPGDEHAICDLFGSVFGRDLPLGFWKWRYSDNPAGGPHVELAWDGDRLAAHYAASATRLALDGQAVDAALSMTTMTHSDYRGQGLFERLAERLYDRLSETGHALVFGFPNANSHRGFRKRLAWQTIYEIPTMTLRAMERARALESPAGVREVTEFGPEFDRLWDRLRQKQPIWTWRDRRYLDWRYTRNPISSYRICAWHDADELLGYCVVKTYNDEVMDVVEFVAEEERLVPGLAAWCIAQANAAGLARIATWIPATSPLRVQLESLGFAAEAPVTYFGARSFRDARTDVADHRNWHFSMGDSDVY